LGWFERLLRTVDGHCPAHREQRLRHHAVQR
jgi:hypothetical protein